ncbi:MAG: hypothetical protein LBF51_05630 [Zoogloeaceae bacterium]|jgi:hypothetical protein|nr:hypothetical protein [Zoogloeaceae bacterium]
MNTLINLNFFLLAKSEKSKENVVKKIKGFLDNEFKEDVLQGGKYCYQVNICYESWELSVYRMLQACQSIGRQWILTGDINFEFSAWTNHPKIVGVESIGISADNCLSRATVQ